MLHGEWALDHRDGHAVVLTGVEVPMGSVRWHEYGLSSLERSVIVTHDGDSFALPTEHNFIRNRMAMKAVLLTWFEAVDVAMELSRLPDPPPHKPVE